MAMIHTKIMDNFLANHSVIIQFAGCKGTVHTKLYDNSICGLTLFGDRPQFIREYYRLTCSSYPLNGNGLWFAPFSSLYSGP